LLLCVFYCTDSLLDKQEKYSVSTHGRSQTFILIIMDKLCSICGISPSANLVWNTAHINRGVPAYTYLWHRRTHELLMFHYIYINCKINRLLLLFHSASKDILTSNYHGQKYLLNLEVLCTEFKMWLETLQCLSSALVRVLWGRDIFSFIWNALHRKQQTPSQVVCVQLRKCNIKWLYSARSVGQCEIMFMYEIWRFSQVLKYCTLVITFSYFSSFM
jgi:hypothetical protein